MGCVSNKLWLETRKPKSHILQCFEDTSQTNSRHITVCSKRRVIVGGLTHTLITGAGSTGTPFLQSDFSLRSWRQDHGGFTQRTQTEREREKRKGKDTKITNRKWKVGKAPTPVREAHAYRNDIRNVKSKRDGLQPQVFVKLWHTDSCWHLLAYMHTKLSSFHIRTCT